MATADEYAAWIVKNESKKGTPDFESVARAYQAAKQEEAVKPSMGSMLKDEILTSLPGGAVRGLKDVVDTGAQGLAWLSDRVTGGGESARVGAMNQVGKDEFKGAQDRAGAGGSNVTRVVGNILATAPIGGLFAKGAQALRAGPAVVNALRTGGMSTGAAPVGFLAKAGDLALRTGAGAAVGGASDLAVGGDGVAGATVGAALPGVLKVAGGAGGLAGKGARKLFSGAVSDDVANLAKRAKDLGIDIPADRLVDSRPLNAAAASLNYMPFSGRAATEDKMVSQLNRAVSRTFGQDSSNVTMALRKAGDDLGAKFDHTLRNNGVAFDKQLLDDVSSVYNRAESELGSDLLKPITAKVNDLIAKGASGTIEGQAAYNIKRELDRLGRGNTPTAFHALELKSVLMDALNRSLGPEKAAAFAQTRQHYGNMLALEKLAKNGVEGELSAARLANMQNINNKPLQEIADIAAQFVKGREGMHGAAQRVGLGGLGLGVSAAGGPAVAAGLAAGAAVGHAGNSVLNSQTLKNLMLGEKSPPNKLAELLRSPQAQQMLYRSAPVISAQ